MLGKWHVTPLTETGATGPFDGWPLGRGFDRYYGFMDAETDQYAPELVRDNTPVDPPGSFAGGYHLTADLVDQGIRYLADHVGDRPDAVADVARAWCLPRAAPGAVRAHQEVRRRVHGTAGTTSATSDSRARRRSASCRRTRACRRATTTCGLGRPARERASPLHAPAGRLRRHARACRPAYRAPDGLPRGGGPARRHAGRDPVRQRRQPGGRAVGHGQRHGSLQPEARADRGEDRAHRRHRRARHPLELSAGLGDGRQHAAAALQAEHPRRRHPRPAGDLLAPGHRRARRDLFPVLPCLRCGADPARCRAPRRPRRSAA